MNRTDCCLFGCLGVVWVAVWAVIILFATVLR